MKIRGGELVTGIVLGASVLGTIFFCHERGMEEMGLVEIIRAEVKAEMDRRYRNIPRIEISKVYTLNATGEDVVIEEVENGPEDERPGS